MNQPEKLKSAEEWVAEVLRHADILTLNNDTFREYELPAIIEAIQLNAREAALREALQYVPDTAGYKFISQAILSLIEKKGGEA